MCLSGKPSIQFMLFPLPLLVLIYYISPVAYAVSGETANKTVSDFSKTYDSSFLPSSATKKADLLRNIFSSPVISVQKSDVSKNASVVIPAPTSESTGTYKVSNINGTSYTKFLELPSIISNVAYEDFIGNDRSVRPASKYLPNLNITYAKPKAYTTSAPKKYTYTINRTPKTTPPAKYLSPSSYDIITEKSQRESRADDYTDSDSNVQLETSYKSQNTVLPENSAPAAEDANYGDGYNLGYIAAAGETAYSGWGGNGYGGGGGYGGSGGGSYGGDSHGGGGYGGGDYGGASKGGSYQSGYGGWGWGGHGGGNGDQTLLYALAIKLANLRDRYHDDIEYRDSIIASMQKRRGGLLG